MVLSLQLQQSNVLLCREDLMQARLKIEQKESEKAMEVFRRRQTEDEKM